MPTRNQPICSTCNNESLHSENYDAYYCIECNTWNEDVCGDPDCYFCKGRPAKPSAVSIDTFRMIPLLIKKLGPIEISNLVRMFDDGSLRNVFEGTISTNGLIDADKKNFPSMYGDKDA